MNNIRTREENPFEEEDTAKLWATSVEGERGMFRDLYVYPMVREWLKDPWIKNVLDIGAGQGAAAHLAEGKRYVGVEPSKHLVARARRLHGGQFKFLIGNAYELPFACQSFDAAFAINVWFHLRDLQRAAREHARVLRPGGKALLVSANPDAYDIWRAWYKNATETAEYIMGAAEIPLVTLPKNILYKHSAGKLIRSLEDAGLCVQQTGAFAPLEDGGRGIFAYYRCSKRL